MIVLGIDVGFAISGWSVIRREKGTNTLIDYGIIASSSKSELPCRLREIYDGVTTIIRQYSPDSFAIESLFYFKNQKTVIAVAQARGVLLLAAEEAGLKIFNYTPLQVKMAVTGYGRADKKQIQKMVTTIMGLKEIPKPDDAADAIAVSICHINSVK